ncbi:threonylcarbamoyl-AMP synthase [Alicyclobacillus hesperidum subsp. aegles]|uniref:L-threonylcarbamoyladenylate synthase n=1 Tax=Alicyclobacillus hesperidum TaxID=89784 RepID=UPI002228BA49|nr:L-threonylcarbamoyladenylate synthase [Alicyclobacillus hesperidum]GLG01998.1 threonylcarbamoyl-AMP synthase [Alicyclobacillus hesperidum subsp. aegles]
MNRCAIDDLRDVAQLRRRVAEPAASLRAGGLVAFPTETVYGLGANALDDTAVRRIFAAKQRPVDNPLIVHIANEDQLETCLPAGYQLRTDERKLMQTFWPGPLTLLLPAGPQIAPAVRPGQELVGVRMPNHPVARALIAEAGVPVAAPSANISGRPSPTVADAVAADLGGVIDWLIDAGPSAIGVESTVLLLEPDCARILRPGGITQEMIARTVQRPVLFAADVFDLDAAPLSPGMKYRHYAPNARVHVWWGEEAAIASAMRAFLEGEGDGADAATTIPALIAPQDFVSRFEWHLPPARMAALPADDYAANLAHALYDLLRRFDKVGATDILVYGVDPAHGISTAVMNRLQKAASGRVRRVE